MTLQEQPTVERPDWFGTESPWTLGSEHDWWRMSVAHDGQLDLDVRSSQQPDPRVTRDGGRTRYSYDSLVAFDGRCLPITLDVYVVETPTGFDVWGEGRASTPTLVNEVTLPLISSAPRDPAAREVLYRPLGLGQRIEDPRSFAARSHTEYMAGDQRGIWNLAAYPGELSMAWQCLEADGWIAYLGRHDEQFSSSIFRVGCPPREDDGTALLQGVSAPISPTGDGSFRTPPVTVEVRRGTWRDAVVAYRQWADSWYTGPASDEFAQLAGWQRVIMKHQYGEVLLRYADLVKVHEVGEAAGIDTIMLFGWWKGCFDRGYPDYEPDPALGGAAALDKAIRTIEQRGGRVLLYANGNLIDRATDWYRLDASQSTRKGYRGIETTLGYPFSSQSASLRHFAGQEFVMGCHGAEKWRSTMLGVGRTLQEQGTSHLFFDQVGYHLMAWPCTDSRHEHGNDWYGQEAELRSGTIRTIREALPGITFGSEGFVDCMVPSLDYHHGWGFAFRNEEGAFPHLFRCAFPEPTVTNRLVHDESDGWRQQLRYALTFNLAFDIAIHRGRGDLRNVPAYAAEVRELNALRKEFGNQFSSGHAECPADGADDGLVHMRYGVLDPLDIIWNAGAEECTWEDVQLSPGALHLRTGRRARTLA